MPTRRVDDFPHQLSGGMRQRAMIAMALACDPALLIADEPTTALDVTIQAQILDLLRALGKDPQRPLSMMFITHNLGIVAELADRVIVLYAGRIMEEGDVRAIFRRPAPSLYARAAGLDARERRVRARQPGPAAAARHHRTGPEPAQSAAGMSVRAALRDGATCVPRRCPCAGGVGDGHRSRCLRWSEL